MQQSSSIQPRPVRISVIAEQLEWERQHWLYHTMIPSLVESGFSIPSATLVMAHASLGLPKWGYAPVRMEGFKFREEDAPYEKVLELARGQVALMELEDVRLLASVKPRGDEAQRRTHGAFIWAAQQRLKFDDGPKLVSLETSIHGCDAHVTEKVFGGEYLGQSREALVDLA